MNESVRDIAPRPLSLPPISASAGVIRAKMGGLSLNRVVPSSFHDEAVMNEKPTKLRFTFEEGGEVKEMDATTSETISSIKYRMWREWGVAMQDTVLTIKGMRLADPLSLNDVVTFTATGVTTVDITVQKRGTSTVPHLPAMPGKGVASDTPSIPGSIDDGKSFEKLSKHRSASEPIVFATVTRKPPAASPLAETPVAEPAQQEPGKSSDELSTEPQSVKSAQKSPLSSVETMREKPVEFLPEPEPEQKPKRKRCTIL